MPFVPTAGRVAVLVLAGPSTGFGSDSASRAGGVLRPVVSSLPEPSGAVVSLADAASPAAPRSRWVSSLWPLDWTPQVLTVCRTVVADLGPPGDPQFVLTQASSWRVDADGLAVVRRHDPCDPTRPPRADAPGGLSDLTVTGAK